MALVDESWTHYEWIGRSPGHTGRRDLNEVSHFAIEDGTSSFQSVLIGQYCI
jgi:hypothetical protein